jgi:hypothetical protein
MTLCQMVLTPSGVWACTDHKISVIWPDGHVTTKTDATRKLVTLTNDDHRLIIVYTGLAEARRGVETGEWLRRVLRWGREATLDDVVGRLAEYAEQHLAQRAFQLGTPHAFVMGGFRRDGSPVSVTISNYDEEDSAHTVRRHFAAVAWNMPGTAALMAPLVWQAYIPAKYRTVLEHLSATNASPRHPDGLLKLLLTTNYYMAHIKALRASVSEHAVAVYVPSPTTSGDHRPTVRTTHATLGRQPHRWQLTPEPPGLEAVQNAGLIDRGWDFQVIAEAVRNVEPLPSWGGMSEEEMDASFRSHTDRLSKEWLRLWSEEP